MRLGFLCLLSCVLFLFLVGCVFVFVLQKVVLGVCIVVVCLVVRAFASVFIVCVLFV